MMAIEPQHLKNAPIVEAMIAFDFVISVGELGQIRRSFVEQIQVEYPTQTPIQKAEVTFNPEGSTGKMRIYGREECLCHQRAHFHLFAPASV